MTLSPREIAGSDLRSCGQFVREVVHPCRPVVIRGLVSGWPVVQCAQASLHAFNDYLLTFDVGGQMEAFFGDPAIRGKYYYTDDLHGFNFERRQMRLAAALAALVEGLQRPGSKTLYVGSLPTAEFLPGFAAQNPMPLLGPEVHARIWLGHASNIASHYDTLDNLACVIAGARSGPNAATAMMALTTRSTGMTSTVPSGTPGNSFSRPRA